MTSTPARESMRRKRGEQTVYLRSGLGVPSLDDTEGMRLNTQHRLLASVAKKRIHFARVRNPKAILDIASGTGIWGFEMAQHFRQAAITNLDINAPMGQQWLRVLCANRSDLHRRLYFVEADALRPLPFAEDIFDFTHGRLLDVFVPYADWPRVVREMVRVTRPGGWIELAGGEYPQLDTPAFGAMRKAVIQLLGSVLHLHLNASAHYTEFLQESGAENIKSEVLQVGARPSQRSKLADNFVASAQALRGPLVAAGVITSETFDILLPRFRQEIIESGLIWHVRVCWGQKPVSLFGPSG